MEALPESVKEELAIMEEAVLTCAVPFTNLEALADAELAASIDAVEISTSEGNATTALAADTSALPLSNNCPLVAASDTASTEALADRIKPALAAKEDAALICTALPPMTKPLAVIELVEFTEALAPLTSCGVVDRLDSDATEATPENVSTGDELMLDAALICAEVLATLTPIADTLLAATTEAEP